MPEDDKTGHERIRHGQRGERGGLVERGRATRRAPTNPGEDRDRATHEGRRHVDGDVHRQVHDPRGDAWIKPDRGRHGSQDQDQQDDGLVKAAQRRVGLAKSGGQCTHPGILQLGRAALSCSAVECILAP